MNNPNNRIEELETVLTEYIPETIENGKIYVSHRFSLAIHLCACGCGVKTVTPFYTDDQPRTDIEGPGWHLTQDTEHDNKITLHPSIGNQQFPCKSHYWVKNGKATDWC